MKEKDKNQFEDPKAVDLEGKEITTERLEEEELEGVAGGFERETEGELCLGGG